MQPGVLEEIRTVSEKYGSIAEESWGARAGAIDLVSILEIVGIFVAMKRGLYTSQTNVKMCL